ncbi:uncharacterized protein LOC100835913 [Brachypodium distachyon]|uniref:DUF1618 domain-containing protein n=1 Tax=Brachypodium distachyon TaxID=15368 RepID=I1H9P3_BRADI|nr:uncharacterized protein LOC100835913 [Brachypodium distachyon]KQK23630.1 hypothetical protein BRADI_1g75060v3 [Brachypodium distachyon]|eukprot:XP_003562076.1 uncharacterized protein LOC100835913 [Brachypodium distachyon]
MAADRSCVILVLSDYRDETYTLHHIDVAPFFSGGPDDELDAMDDDIPLPPASARFAQPPTSSQHCSYVDFHLLLGPGAGAGDVKVVSTDGERRTVIYDVASRAVRGGPMMRAIKTVPVSAAVGDGLYVLDTMPLAGSHRRFEALRYDRLREDWFWHVLPLPPYARDPARPRVTAHTVGAGGRIWTSAENGAGTYSFDARRRSWRKEGGWSLPFVGKAEHVHDGGLTLGFSSMNGTLCAVDLATATAESPPAVRGVWEEFRPPVEWFPRNSSLVHLGSGKLCVFRFFGTDTTDSRSRDRDPVAVITALEVCDDGAGGEINMVRHRSRRIKLENHNTLLKLVL